MKNKKEGSKSASTEFLDEGNFGGAPDPQDLEFGPGNYEAIKHTCEAIGQIIESWGFKKVFGMTWAFLYLCPEPASAKDLCETLSISPALVSITLQDLLRWGVVKKISPLGKRRDYYTAEHDVWKMIRKVFREREKVQMEHVHSKLASALDALDSQSSASANLKSRRTCQFQRVRIEDLLSVTTLALQLLEGFISQGKVDVEPMFSVLKPYNQLAISTKTN